MSESQLLEVIEQYLNGEMNREEREQFELLRKQNAEIDAKVVEHQLFTDLLKQYSKRVELENRLNAIHSEIDVNDLKESLMVHPIWVVQMWRNHHSKISVAASIAIFAILSIMFFTGKFNDNPNNIAQLKNEVRELNRSNQKLSRSINDIKAQNGVVIRDKESSTGTGFAVTSDGLIATNYHVIQGADSVYVQNDEGESFKAQVLYTEPQNDIAILKIADKSFNNLGNIPYAIKKSESPLAEPVSTYGYPGGLPGYNNGNLSSKSGINGDSVHYQISIPINPGNSGGPLWDSKGNIIGLTDAKQIKFEGSHYAVKSKYLIDAIHNIPVDSLKGKSVTLNKKNSLAGLSDVQRINKMKKYIFMVKVYND